MRLLLVLTGLAMALYLFIGMLGLAWIDYDDELFHFIAEWPVPMLELVLLFGAGALASLWLASPGGGAQRDGHGKHRPPRPELPSSHRRRGVGV